MSSQEIVKDVSIELGEVNFVHTNLKSSEKSVQEFPLNTMSYFILTSMNFKGKDVKRSSIMRAMAIAGPSFFCCLFIQAIFLYELMGYISRQKPVQVEASTSVVTLQVCSVTLFLIDICSSLSDLCIQGMIIFSKTYNYRGQEFQLRITTIYRVFIFLITTLSELIIFVSCCAVSIRYLLSAHNIESIILNTLAISFIMECDEIFFNALVPESQVNTIKKITVHLPYFLGSTQSKKMNLAQKVQQIYIMLFHLPLCITISMLSVIIFASVPLDKVHLNSTINGTSLTELYESGAFFGSVMAVCFLCLIIYRCKKKNRDSSANKTFPTNSLEANTPQYSSPNSV